VKPTQADNKIEVAHMLTFDVNSLNEELTKDLGEGVETR
jgi:hypothetical protein